MRAADQLHRSAHERQAHGPRQHSGGGPETDGAADERGQHQRGGCGWPAAAAETVCIHLQHGHRYRVSCQVIRSSQVLLYSSPRKTWAPRVNCKQANEETISACIKSSTSLFLSKEDVGATHELETSKERKNICMY